MKSEYRAWHKGTKKMCEVYYINWDLGKAGIYLEGACTMVPLESIILMKNTGKKDISGQEVYEGDFLNSIQGQVVLDVLMLVKYGEYEAYCPADRTYMDSVGFYVEAEGYPQMPVGPLEYYAKVIGNVYENGDWLVKAGDKNDTGKETSESS